MIYIADERGFVVDATQHPLGHSRDCNVRWAIAFDNPLQADSYAKKHFPTSLYVILDASPFRKTIVVDNTRYQPKPAPIQAPAAAVTPEAEPKTQGLFKNIGRLLSSKA